ncbi:MAG: DNA/RNA non-specific endonuclease [Bacteroidales bacterium]|nr:DNA/RNA non-specific endonuclease [Bacteroidales bacterium]
MKILRFITIILAILAFANCSPEPLDDPKNGTEQPGNDNPGDQTGTDNPAPTVNVLGNIYSQNFDGNPSYHSYMSEGNWSNASGSGAAGVTFDTWNASISNNSYGSTNAYQGASGVCYANIYQSNSGVFGYCTISGIRIGTYKNFRLRFGAIQTSEVLKLEVSTDDSNWTSLAYTNGKAYNSWGRAEVCFSVGSGVTRLSIKFTLLGDKTTYTYGGKIDDIALDAVDTAYETVIGGGSGGGGETPQLLSRYAELPVIDNTNPDYYYNTLYTTTVRTNKRVRNFSFCYDTRRHNPIWVAFPMHSIYSEGSGRSKDENGNDPWMKYPDLRDDQQSIIYDITGDGKHMFWGNSASQGVRQDNGESIRMTWTKGHMCMSSSRSGSNLEINLQTFYPVNISPQPNQYSGLFSTIWGLTEGFHWQGGSQICSDTLYVVTGCKYGDETWTEYDATNWGDLCSYSKKCTIPTHQFKLFLRTRDGNTRKAVHNCAASELKSIGFWMDIFIPTGSSTNLADYAVSVAEIESRTGLTFFPDIPSEVKNQCVPADWGLQ